MAKLWIAQKRRREQAALQEAVRRFAGRGPLALSSLGSLTSLELDALLSFIDEALTSPRQADGTRVARSSDGRFRVTLQAPPAGQAAMVSIDVPTGRLHCLDYRLRIEEAEARAPAARAGGAT